MRISPKENGLYGIEVGGLVGCFDDFNICTPKNAPAYIQLIRYNTHLCCIFDEEKIESFLTQMQKIEGVAA